MKKLAPILLFVYNRPWHTRQTLEALAANPLADESNLFIFSDGPRQDATEEDIAKIEEVRILLNERKWCKSVTVKNRIKNVGLAKNIISGVSEIIDEYGRVIVLEDDIVTSPGFLKYMNDALHLYEHNTEVMHISGFMYPHQTKLPETFFFNVALCWGWATWKTSWSSLNTNEIDLWKTLNEKKLFSEVNKFGGDFLSSQLAHNITGKLSTWFIKWHVSVILKQGYTLYPATSLVNNIGFDNTGVHNGTTDYYENKNLASSIKVEEIPLKENAIARGIIESFYQKNKKRGPQKKQGVKKRIKRLLRRIGVKIFPELKNFKTTTQNTSIVGSYMGSNVKLYPGCSLNNTIIGNYSYVAHNSTINNTIVGKYCSIGPNLLCGWGMHPVHGISTHPMFYSTKKQNGMTLSETDKFEETRPILIGNDVFIGMNVTILDGVTIGDGAVIGAGAVVSKDIPPFAIAVGNPIKVIKYRFEDKIVADLLKSKWWDLTGDKNKLVEKHFLAVEDLLKEINSLSK